MDPFMISEIDMSEIDEMMDQMDAEYAAGRAWTRERLIDPADIAARAPGAVPAQFNCLSLPAWLEIAKRANIAYIPARPLAEMDVDAFIQASDDQESEEGRLYHEFHKQIVRDLKDGEMIRMEQVAPIEIKSELSAGRDMNSGLFDTPDGNRLLDLHEDRYYMTLKDLGADKLRAFARPIIQPMMFPATDSSIDDGLWPVEFRVFIQNGEITGVSNYYPQIELDNYHFNKAVRSIIKASQAMIDTMNQLKLAIGNHAHCADRVATDNTPQRPDWMTSDWGDQDFTLDFMLLEKNFDVIFLEGGPAGLKAAHPCCFLQEGRPMDENFLTGVAWSATQPIIQFSEMLGDNETTDVTTTDDSHCPR